MTAKKATGLHRDVAMAEIDPAEQWRLPWEGGCRCGQVRLKVTAPPLLAAACHCTGCQTMSASAYSLSLAVPSEGFEVTRGEPALGGRDRDVHYFCPACMTWMFTRPTGMDWFVNLRPTMLDDHGWFEPFIETYTCERLPWAATPAKHSFERIPDLPDFEPLVTEYRNAGARPRGRAK